MKNKLIILFSIFLLSASQLAAQNENDKTIEWYATLGFNIGATAPIPIPEEVRAIENYNPKFNPHLGVNILYNLNSKWGIGAELSIDVKGMRVKDEVKYMHINFVPIGGDSKTDRLEGYFVGKNMTDISNTYLTLSMYGNYNINTKWKVKLGGFAASTLKTKFRGDVSDGYLRISTPTGTKQKIILEEFDFSQDIRDFDVGVMAGANYALTNRIGFYGNVSWGFASIFYSDFNPIQFQLRNIFGSLGITYRIK